MRSFPHSIFVIVLGLALVVIAIYPATGQDQLSSNTFATRMLTEHNDWREKYKVAPLTWDETLSADAQEFANRVAAKGVFPPAHRSNTPNGENFFWGTADAFEPKDAVARWESESKHYDRVTNTCAPGKACVHFTQLVWSTTTKVGCGKAKTPDGETEFFVCVYSPAGNTGGGPFARVPATSPKPASPAQQPMPATTPPANSNRPTARRVS